MTGRTWLMMLIVLALNWGGFIALLVYDMTREARRRRGEQGESIPL